MVECTSPDPNAELALMGGDGTMYGNMTNGTNGVRVMARIVASSDNIAAANTTFVCTVSNAQGQCGEFPFESSVIVYGKFNTDVGVKYTHYNY